MEAPGCGRPAVPTVPTGQTPGLCWKSFPVLRSCLNPSPPHPLPQYAQARSKVPQHTAASCWWHLGEMRAEGWQQSGEGRGEERRRPRAGSSGGWASRRTRRGMARDKPPFRKKSRKASVKIGEASPEDDAGNNHCYSLSSECRSPWIQLSTLGSVRRELSGMLLGKPPPQAVG